MKTEIDAPRVVALPLPELLNTIKVEPTPEGICAHVTYPPGSQHLATDSDQVLVAVVPYMLQGVLALLLAGTKRRLTAGLKAEFFKCCIPAPGVTLGKFYETQDGLLWQLSWVDVDQLRVAVASI